MRVRQYELSTELNRKRSEGFTSFVGAPIILPTRLSGAFNKMLFHFDPAALSVRPTSPPDSAARLR